MSKLSHREKVATLEFLLQRWAKTVMIEVQRLLPAALQIWDTTWTSEVFSKPLMKLLDKLSTTMCILWELAAWPQVITLLYPLLSKP